MYVRQIKSDARAREKPCLRCGVSLRKHLDDRYCPQCGLSVWMSLNPNDALDYSDARWLRKAARGAWFMATVQLVGFAAYLLAMASIAASFTHVAATPARHKHAATGPAVAATRPRHAARAPAIDDDAFDLSPASPVPLAGSMALRAVYFLLEAAGLVLLTPDERRYPDRLRPVRTAARVMAGVAALAGVGLAGYAAVTLAGHSLAGLFDWLVLLGVELVFAGCGSVCWFWLRPIARRSGRGTLARLCGYLLFLPVLPFLKAAPFLGLYAFYLVGPLLHFVPLVYIPASVVLLARLALLLQRAVPHAEAAWAAESRPPA